MNVRWIDTLMDLNERISAMEARLSAQASRIAAIRETGEDPASAEEVFTGYRDGLDLLRGMRDALLIEGEG